MLVTPILFDSIRSTFYPLQKNGNVYSFFRDEEIVTEAETLGEVLDRLGVKDVYNLNRDQLVGKVTEYEQPSHFYCSGVVYFWIGLVKPYIGRFDCNGLVGLLVSLSNETGILETRIPG